MLDDLIVLGLVCGGGVLLLCGIEWVLSFLEEDETADYTWAAEAFTDSPWCEVCQAPHWYGQCPVHIVPRPPYDWKKEEHGDYARPF